MPDKPKLLVVDDSHANLLAMEAVFDAAEYDVVRAYSGAQALEEVVRHDFAAILLDVQMPVMDGYETARRIKALPRGKDIPIIFVTAVYKEDEDVRRGYEAGGIDYLAKPLLTEIIKAKVRIYAELYRRTRELGENERLLAQVRDRLRAENKLEAVLDSISEGVIIVDKDGSVTHMSTAARRIIAGSKPFLAQEREALAACWQENRERAPSRSWALTKALQTGKMARGNSRALRCLDGTERTVVDSAQPVRDEKGEVVGAVCLLTEVPESD